MRSLHPIFLVALIALTLGACSGGGQGDGDSARTGMSQDFSPVIADVGGVPITRAYFDYRYDTLPAMEKARFSGEGWEERFLKRLVEEVLIMQAAEAENLDKVRGVEWELEKGNIDLAVHSLKDVPAQIMDGTQIVAVSEREDPRDVIFLREGSGFADLREGATVATGSLRRRAQLRACSW